MGFWSFFYQVLQGQHFPPYDGPDTNTGQDMLCVAVVHPNTDLCVAKSHLPVEGKSCPSTVPPSEVSPVCIVLFSVGCIWMHCCREQQLSSWLLFTLSSLRQILTILRVRQFGWTGWPANLKDPLVSASPTWLSSHTYSPHSISSLLCVMGKRHTYSLLQHECLE